MIANGRDRLLAHCDAIAAGHILGLGTVTVFEPSDSPRLRKGSIAFNCITLAVDAWIKPPAAPTETITVAVNSPAQWDALSEWWRNQTPNVVLHLDSTPSFFWLHEELAPLATVSHLDAPLSPFDIAARRKDVDATSPESLAIRADAIVLAEPTRPPQPTDSVSSGPHAIYFHIIRQLSGPPTASVVGVTVPSDARRLIRNGSAILFLKFTSTGYELLNDGLGYFHIARRGGGIAFMRQDVAGLQASIAAVRHTGSNGGRHEER